MLHLDCALPIAFRVLPCRNGFRVVTITFEVGRMTRVVLDVGKTNVRLVATNAEGDTLEILSRPNHVLPGPPYPHFDVDGIYTWILNGLASLAKRFEIDAIIPVAHGAAGAALDAAGRLVLPVLDYEHPGPTATRDLAADYEALARRFDETGSPALPDGLNLGRQFFWLAAEHPDAFANIRWLLPYPQYWAHRLSGVIRSEVTSLGCHTDLWNSRTNTPSTFAHTQGWAELLPPLVPAWERLGPITAEVARATGLSPACEVVAGIHDSNASYLCHRAVRHDAFAVVSTGTWIIVMSGGGQCEGLRPDLDTLVNIDAFGAPVPTARFMGGREYELLAEAAGLAETARPEVAWALFERGTMALPAFTAHGGPFRHRTGGIVGPKPESAAERAALASLYAALVTDYCLDLLDASGEVIVEGRFAANRAYTTALAALRGAGAVLRSEDETGTIRGAAILAAWPSPPPPPRLLPCDSRAAPGLQEYRDHWRSLALG